MKKKYYYHGRSVLPTQSRVDPKHLDSNWLLDTWDKEGNLKKVIFYLVKFTYGPTKGYRLISSFGGIDKIGTSHEYMHDQTLKQLGYGETVAAFNITDLYYKLPAFVGKKSVALWVYK